VVPEGAVRAKLAAIEHYGARLHFCAPTMAAREQAAERVRAETGAELVHPFTDERVIVGQGTAALELIDEAGRIDALVTPVGGGGLISGSALAAHGIDPGIAVHGAEPSGADDAYRSLRSGTRVTSQTPDTVCDGLRGIAGEINLALMRAHRVEVSTVPDSQTLAAMRLLFERMKLVVEPSSAIALAAILAQPEAFRGKRVGVILSGGNVDLEGLRFG
jgi:threonine dehydratase